MCRLDRGRFGPDQAPPGYGPADFQSAYNLPSATAGSGQTVAIVDAGDDPTAEADLAVYRAQYGLPPCTTANGCFEKVNQQGQQGNYPPVDGTWPIEESLDVDMVSAICPLCRIILVEANSSVGGDLFTAEDEAVTLGAKYVSDSWLVQEQRAERTVDYYFNHPGVAITAASGDSGYQVNYPAVSPYVTAVGGTSLTQDSSVSRGWAETAWGGTGSGCSLYEPKPFWQHDSGCAKRTTSDVSADADPSTGAAVYVTSGGEDGWRKIGGTSEATPIIAAVYALAGAPAADSYPASYPYADSSALNDVTAGSNGTCKPAYLCTAGPGYDGPTGLGTPDGVAAFQGSGQYGEITGRITAQATGKPLASATVSTPQGYTTTTNLHGSYTLFVPVGSYDLTVRAFGYETGTATGVTVSNDQTATENFPLATIPYQTVSGTVSDGSGHKWPVYAKISVPGVPVAPVYSNPYTGAYSISLPGQTTYQLQVTPLTPGYTAQSLKVSLGATGQQQNIAVAVNRVGCNAPGYALKTQGAETQFTGWTGTSPQDGWTITPYQAGAATWVFGSNPTGEDTDPAPPGSDGQFAVADSNANSAATMNTSLISPGVNLTGLTDPQIAFDTWYREYGTTPESAEVDLSLDGGQTWASVWQQTTSSVRGRVTIPIPQAAGQANVRVRFAYTGSNDWWWSLDNVSIGTVQCAGVPGGLVAGQVTDANTGTALDGATVASTGSPAESEVTSDAPGAGDGFYELFAAGTGAQQFTAADSSYATATAAVDVARGAVTRQDFTLDAGRITATPGSVSAAVTLGNSATRKVTFTNTGTAPAQINLTGESNGFTPPGAPGQAKTASVPLRIVKARISVGMNLRTQTRAGTRMRHRAAPSSGTDWASIANYPLAVSDPAVAYNSQDATIYSIGGYNGNFTSAAYTYNPGTQKWSSIADAPVGLAGGVAAFVNGTLYLIGGFLGGDVTSSSVYAYDPGTNSWSQVASLPQAIYSPGLAVLNGQIYVVGGCLDAACNATAEVYEYNPASNTWTQLPNYPKPVSNFACAGIDGEIVCAGGNDTSSSQVLSSTYIYRPNSGVWTQGADMPYSDFGMSYTSANGQLQIATGATSYHALTNQAEQYDPSSNTWTALPNTVYQDYRGDGACGFYQIAGLDSTGTPADFAQVLPGYDLCTSSSAPWLKESSSSIEVPPGQSVTATVTMNSNSTVMPQPGTQSGALLISTDTPYPVPPLSVTFQARPPASWGELSGTVTDATTGNPVSQAEITICTMYDPGSGSCGPATYSPVADLSGSWQWWLASGYNPLQVIASKNGYLPQTKIVKVARGAATTVDFSLTPTT